VRDFPFTAGPGERVSARITNLTGDVDVTVLDAGGASVGTAPFVPPGGFMEPVDLPAPGNYTVRVTPRSKKGAGDFSLEVFLVPPDATAQIVPNGDPVTVANTVPGQNMRLTFDVKESERVSALLSNVTFPRGMLGSIVAPDGSSGSVGLVGDTPFMDTQVLTQSGTYTLLLDAPGDDLGQVTVALLDVPPDPRIRTRPGSRGLTLTTTVPGQNMQILFPGQAGERISALAFDLTDGVLANLFDPNGAELVETGLPAPQSFFDVQTLPQDGIYRLEIDLLGANTGSATIRLFDVPPDPVGTVKVDGGGLTLRTTTPGQNLHVLFEGVSGQTVTIHVGDVSFEQGLFVEVFQADGTRIDGGTAVGAEGDVSVTLPADGSSTITLDPPAAETGRATVSVSQG